MRFRDQNIVFANGDTGPSKGQNSAIPTANPLNYFHVISNSAELPKLAIDGKRIRLDPCHPRREPLRDVEQRRSRRGDRLSRTNEEDARNHSRPLFVVLRIGSRVCSGSRFTLCAL